MTLVVEDGTIVSGANSYLSVDDYIAMALDRGIIIDPDDAEIQLTKSMDYLETQTYAGDLVEDDQPLQEPRTGVYINGIEQTATQIVNRMAKAQYELGVGFNDGNDQYAPIESAIKEESFAVFKTVYQDGAGQSVVLPKVSAWLDPLLTGGGGGSFTCERTYG